MEISVGANGNELESSEIFDDARTDVFDGKKIYWTLFDTESETTCNFHSVLNINSSSASAIREAWKTYSGLIYSSNTDSRMIDNGNLFVCGEFLREDLTLNFDTSADLKFFYIKDPTSWIKNYYKNSLTKYSLDSRFRNTVIKKFKEDAISIEGVARVRIAHGQDESRFIFSSLEGQDNNVTLTGGRGYVTIESGVSLVENSPSDNVTLTAMNNTSVEFDGGVNSLQTLIFNDTTTVVSIIGGAAFEFDDSMHLSSGMISLGGAASQFGNISGGGVILSSGDLVTSLDEVGDFVEIVGIYGEDAAWNSSGGTTRYEVFADGLHVESSNESGETIFSRTLEGSEWIIPTDRKIFDVTPSSDGSGGSKDHESSGSKDHESSGSEDHESTGSRDHDSTGSREHDSTGSRDHDSTGSRDHESTGSRDHESTGSRDHDSTGSRDHESIGSRDHESIGSRDHDSIGSKDHESIGSEDHESIGSRDHGSKFYSADSNFDNIISISSSDDGKTFNLVDNQTDAFIISPPSQNAYITIENIEFDENDTLILDGYNISDITSDNLVAGGMMIFESNGFSVTLDGTTSARDLDASILHISDESHDDQILTWTNTSNSTLDFSNSDSDILLFDNLGNNLLVGTQFDDTIHAGLNDSIFGGGGDDEIFDFSSTNLLILDAGISDFFTDNDDLLIHLENNSSIRLDGVVGFIGEVQILDSSDERRFSINVPTT